MNLYIYMDVYIYAKNLAVSVYFFKNSIFIYVILIFRETNECECVVKKQQMPVSPLKQQSPMTELLV